MDDLDTLLAEADALLCDTPTAPAPPPPANRTQRCITLQLVAPPSGLGRNCRAGAGLGCGCGTLRCTACDWHVLAFDDCAWADRVEYMFFRNSHPHEARLRQGVVARRGARAYCCQCRWVTVEGSQRPPRSWVCGKH